MRCLECTFSSLLLADLDILSLGCLYSAGTSSTSYVPGTSSTSYVPGASSTSVPDGAATLYHHSSTSALDSSTSCYSGMSCEDIQGTLFIFIQTLLHIRLFQQIERGKIRKGEV